MGIVQIRKLTYNLNHALHNEAGPVLAIFPQGRLFCPCAAKLRLRSAASLCQDIDEGQPCLLLAFMPCSKTAKLV